MNFFSMNKESDPVSGNSNPGIVFMGSPDFAVASLDALIKSGFNVVAVITAPDKPAGRGMHTNATAVKKYAIQKDLSILQPPKLKDPEFLAALRAINADLQVVVAFRMLPELVWNLPPLGTINLHASLLPQYRGAAPINWAIINGEKETGLTTFKLRQEIDTGNILLQEKVSIGAEETAGQLYDRMKEIGAGLLVRTVSALFKGELKETPQRELPSSSVSELKSAPKINTGTAAINWALPGHSIHNLIRGLSPYPGAFTTLNEKIFKILNSSFEPGNANAIPGTFQTDGKKVFRFACADGYISCLEVQLEGKKKMSIEEFLRGQRFS
jgi:methionyl-tRNA formyltransferase